MVYDFTQNEWSSCKTPISDYVIHSLHLSHDEQFLYFVVDTVIYQLDASTGVVLNRLFYDPSDNLEIWGIDVSPNDNNVVLFGGSDSFAFGSNIQVDTFTPNFKFEFEGNTKIVDTKWISDNDAIVVFSTLGLSPFTETYERHNNGVVTWSRNLICTDC